ncbi:MAG: DNA adenine methylase, partial [Desulfobacteraceae bacterium]|nr:DNA adenine methylase [Desulfobacteraceae bacterium]
MTRAIIAKTHPPEYLLHKYWARKPHNVIAHYIAEYFKKGDLLCDPFCGSGVFLTEAKKQGIDSLGFDINPVAALISKITADPPSIDQLTNTFNAILEEMQQRWKPSYRVNN